MLAQFVAAQGINRDHSGEHGEEQALFSDQQQVSARRTRLKSGGEINLTVILFFLLENPWTMPVPS